jgi:hypothetical protein
MKSDKEIENQLYFRLDSFIENPGGTAKVVCECSQNARLPASKQHKERVPMKMLLNN